MLYPYTIASDFAAAGDNPLYTNMKPIRTRAEEEIRYFFILFSVTMVLGQNDTNFYRQQLKVIADIKNPLTYRSFL